MKTKTRIAFCGLLAAIVVLPNLLLAQAPPATNDALPAAGVGRGVFLLKGFNEAELGKVFDKYATMAGGWHLEQRCKSFVPALQQEFEWYLSQMTVMLGQVAKREFLAILQQAGQRTAASYTCSDEVNRKLILPAFLDSRTMVKMLTDMEYSPGQQLAHDLQRAAHLLHGQAIDDQCKYMPPEIRTEYDGNIQQITDGLTSQGGAGAVATLRSVVQQTLARQPVNCDGAARRKLMTAFGESRAMTRR